MSQLVRMGWRNLLFYLSIISRALSQEKICKSDLFQNFTMSPAPEPLLPVGIQILLPSHPLTCSGHVTRWGVRVEGKGGHTVEFQIWRPTKVDESNQLPSAFEKVAQQPYYIEPMEGEKTVYIQLQSGFPTFKKGDLIGLYLEDNLNIEDDFRVPYQENSTGSVILYKTATEPHAILEKQELTGELLGAVPLIKVFMETDSLPHPQTEALSKATPTTTEVKPITTGVKIPTTAKAQPTATPTDAPTTPKPATDKATSTAVKPTLTTSQATPSTAKPAPTTIKVTPNTSEVIAKPSFATSMATENKPTASQHSTTPTTEQETTNNHTPSADTDTPLEGVEPTSQVLLGCVVGSLALLVVLVSMLLCLATRRRGRGWRGGAEEGRPALVIQPVSDITRGSTTWTWSGTLLTENPAYDHTHQVLVASLNWQPKRSGQGKFQLWKAQYYETPISSYCQVKLAEAGETGRRVEQSYHHYETPRLVMQNSSSISCSNHYERI